MFTLHQNTDPNPMTKLPGSFLQKVANPTRAADAPQPAVETWRLAASSMATNLWAKLFESSDGVKQMIYYMADNR